MKKGLSYEWESTRVFLLVGDYGKQSTSSHGLNLTDSTYCDFIAHYISFSLGAGKETVWAAVSVCGAGDCQRPEPGTYLQPDNGEILSANLTLAMQH